MEKKTGIELIAAERQEQIEKHGRTVRHDIELNNLNQMLSAVKQLIRMDEEKDGIEKAFNAKGFTTPSGWDVLIFGKMISKPYKERLIIAGALLAAEIDRLQSYETTPDSRTTPQP